MGFTPELAVGVYVGYDIPRSMGRSSTGGELAAPIFADFVEAALRGQPATPFNMPAGMRLEWIDPATGVASAGGGVREAFKPGTGANLITSVIGVHSAAFENIQGGNSQGFVTGTAGCGKETAPFPFASPAKAGNCIVYA